jgi:hypothetical protein
MTALRRSLGLGHMLGWTSFVIGALCLGVLPGCGTLVSRFADTGKSGPSTTTAAVLQAARPLVLGVAPAEAPAGTSFHLHLSGLAPSDVVTFSIAAQGGHPYTGPTHSPAPDGTVSAIYETWPTDMVGLYVVLAHTASGKGAFASFRVDPPSAPSA